MLTATLYSLGASAFVFLLPVFATQLLDASAVELGWLWSSLGIGMLAASAWLAWINQGDFQNRLRLISAALAVGAVAVCTLGMLQAPVMAAALIIVFGGSTAVFTPIVWAMLQELTPEPLLGRVFTTFSTGAMASAMAGMAGFGWVADAIGPATSLVGIGVLLLGTATVAAAFSRRQPRPDGSRFHSGVRRFHRVSSPRLISMDMNVRDVKRSQLRRSGFGQGIALLVLCMCALLTESAQESELAESDQHSITSTPSSADQGKMAYYNGSVWPHDNALIAAGMAAYGFKQGALKILCGLLDASLFLDRHRLPELFCGFHRSPGEGPTLYPIACSPQTWSSVAVFLLLQSCLGLRIEAPRSRLSFSQPVLPPFLEHIEIRNLRIGDPEVDLLLEHHAKDVGINILRREGKVGIVVTK